MEDYSVSDDAAQRYDPENLKSDILNTPTNAETGYKLAESVDLKQLEKEHITSIVLAGMGGSSIAGLLIQNFLHDDKLRFFVSQNYNLPKWIDKNTLVIACSYSGNTEETISSFKDARRAGCPIVAVTVGGKLEEYANVSRLPVLTLPAGFQPRSALSLEFFAILRLLERLRLVKTRGIDVTKFRDELKLQLPGLERNGYNLSEKLAGKIPIIYSSSRFSAVSYRWKTQFNENSKTIAFQNVFPELNHNELDGFENLNGNFHAVFLRFEDDHRRVQQRMTLTKNILLKKGVSSTEIGIRGSNILSKMFSTIILGDITSYYLALRLKTNPSRVDVIEDFKKDLGPYVG